MEPVDPGDGTGVLISCSESRNAVGYQLLVGSDPVKVETYQVMADTTDESAALLRGGQ